MAITKSSTAEAQAASLAIRTPRAQCKRNISLGVVSAQDTLRHLPPFMESCRLEAFLLCVPYFGPVKVNWALRNLGLGGHRRLGALTARQRDTIIEYIDARRP